jgi:NAD(P)H-binding
LNRADVETAFAAAPDDYPTALIVALNYTRETDNPWSAVTAPPRLMADSHTNLVAIMKEHNIRKIVTMSAFGTGDSYPSLNFLIRLVIKKSNLFCTFQDHDLVDQELKESGMDFVLARPAMLTDKEAQLVMEHGNAGKGSGFLPSISRKSVAVFLVDAAEKNTWDRSTPVISN